jgi:hypothetical protein
MVWEGSDLDVFPLVKFLHIATLFFAVALAISGEIVVRRLAGSGDARAIGIVVERVKPLGNLSGALFLAGIVLGVVAALTGGFDLLRPWLLMSYVAVAAAFAVSAVLIDPWIARLGTAATSSDDGASAQMRGVIDDPRARYASVALMVIIAVLIFLMVVKPLG